MQFLSAEADKEYARSKCLRHMNLQTVIIIAICPSRPKRESKNSRRGKGKFHLPEFFSQRIAFACQRLAIFRYIVRFSGAPPRANSMHSAANSRNSVDGSKPSKVGSPFFSFCIDSDQTCSYSPMSGTDGVYQHQTRAVLLLGDNNLFRWATKRDRLAHARPSRRRGRDEFVARLTRITNDEIGDATKKDPDRGERRLGSLRTRRSSGIAARLGRRS